MEQGARGVKIWKNIGMELTDARGSYVIVTDAAFKPIFEFLETNDIPVLAHLGEPRNCWLPLEEMTDSGDRAYYRDHPQYHMYLHPEMPSYEDQIEARDRILELYPKLNLVGAHLGSLEWNVDELAKRLDRFPNFNVDMAARIGHLKNQSKEDWQRVRNFLINYQDRVLYATDMELYRLPGQMTSHSFDRIRNVWLNDWIYFVSDSIVHDIKGLKLPREVIDKIYFRNAERIYGKY
jgi:predicted TIM-barrel fold metal-dependent hydrolase